MNISSLLFNCFKCLLKQTERPSHSSKHSSTVGKDLQFHLYLVTSLLQSSTFPKMAGSQAFHAI